MCKDGAVQLDDVSKSQHGEGHALIHWLRDKTDLASGLLTQSQFTNSATLVSLSIRSLEDW